MLRFIDLTVATCHIQIIHISEFMPFFSRENGQNHEYSKSVMMQFSQKPKNIILMRKRMQKYALKKLSHCLKH